MTIAKRLQKLIRDPQGFLERYTLRIAGHPTVSGIQQYALAAREG